MIAGRQKYIPGKFGLLFLVLFLTHRCAAQENMPSGKRSKHFAAYPLGFYTPETGAGIGAAGTMNFRPFKSDTLSPVSQLSAGVAVTGKNQHILSLPFALYFNERKHTLTGELTWNDFIYNYYGTGAGNRRGHFEKYEVKFPLFRVNYLYRLSKSWYAGCRWWLEDYHILSFENNEELQLPSPGRQGGMTSGPGVVALYDTRDNIYYSRKGMYLELVYHNQQRMWGSDFTYNRYRFDWRVFLPLNHSWSVGTQLFGDFMEGNVPFNQMPGIGAGKRGRGYYEGRYRDMNILLYQGELRGMMNNRWGATVFWNYALLSGAVSQFSFANDHAAAGLGLRYAFDEASRTNLRLDIAFPLATEGYIYDPDDVVKIYFTVNEAF